VLETVELTNELRYDGTEPGLWTQFTSQGPHAESARPNWRHAPLPLPLAIEPGGAKTIWLRGSLRPSGGQAAIEGFEPNESWARSLRGLRSVGLRVRWEYVRTPSALWDLIPTPLSKLLPVKWRRPHQAEIPEVLPLEIPGRPLRRTFVQNLKNFGHPDLAEIAASDHDER
jgi:hypothetical protein